MEDKKSSIKRKKSLFLSEISSLKKSCSSGSKASEATSKTCVRLYDYGFRMYDPQLGRWHRKDPLMERHFNYSPYAYCYNNPISLIDPFGLDTTYVPPTPIDPVYCYGKKPEKKGPWGFVFFVGGNSDGSESTARSTSWDRVWGVLNIQDLLDLFDFLKRDNKFKKATRPNAPEMAGKSLKAAISTSDKEIIENNTGTGKITNADAQLIDEKGNPVTTSKPINEKDKGQVNTSYWINNSGDTISIASGDNTFNGDIYYPGDTISEVTTRTEGSQTTVVKEKKYSSR